MLSVLTGLSSAACFAVSDLFVQRASRISGVARVMVWVLLIGLVVVLPVALLVDGLPSGRSQWLGVAFSTAAGVSYVGAYFTLLAALRRGDLSLVTVLSSLQGVMTTVIAVVGGEAMTCRMGVGLTFAIAGGSLAAFRGRARTAAGAGWALLSAVFFSMNLVLYDRAAALPWLSQVAFSRLASVCIFLPIALVATGFRLESQARVPVAAGGALELMGLSLVAVTVRLGPLSVAGVTVAQFATFAVILGLVFLHERPRPHQLVGVACVLASVTLLALGG